MKTYLKKHDLKYYLSDVIKECSEKMDKIQVESKTWKWLAGKKNLAESVLVKFCK